MADPLARRAAIGDPAASREERLAALRAVAASLSPPAARGGEANNHIHTIYSFSPYTPSMAALRAFESGLEVAGSVDHDSIGAAPEMVEACSILGIGGVTGCELRVDFAAAGKGCFAKRKLNNPDSVGIAYMTIQGVPAPRVGALAAFLEPIRARRRERTKEMAEAASDILAGAGLGRIDFEREIAGRSKADEGGGITERHLLAAVAERLVGRYGRGPSLLAGLGKGLGIEPPVKLAALIADDSNPHLVYDILGVLKAGFLDRIFVQPDGRECVPAKAAIDFARSIGAVPAYAYLGDVGESPTGDKKAEKFEDDFIEELFAELKAMGYLAVAYMPPRNTLAQLARVRELCGRYDLMEISGVDINQPRQSFNCPELRRTEFRHLVDTTWALVAHERIASVSPGRGIFAEGDPLRGLPLGERLASWARAGRSLDPRGSAASALDAAAGLAQGRFSK